MKASPGQLRSIFDRIARLDEEIKTLNSDKSEVFKEARGNGYEVKALKIAFKRFGRLQNEPGALEEEDAIVSLYLDSLTGETSPKIGHARVRARDEPAHDPETGEVVEPPEPAAEWPAMPGALRRAG